MGLDREGGHGGAMLAMDMGTGKSKVTVDLISNHKDIRKVLITAPWSAVESVWPGQFDTHGTFNGHVIPLINGSVEKRAQQFETLMKMNERMVFISNFESVWREPFASAIGNSRLDMMVDDEIHRIKSPGGKTSKFFGFISSHVPYRLGLTGTPLPHSPLDIYGQYRFLDPGIFGTSFIRFRGDYAVMGGFQGKQVLNFKNLEQLHNKIYLIAYRVMSDEVFDLPERLDIPRTFKLSPQERKVYGEIEEDFCSSLGDRIFIADNALVKLLRLQEITSGYIERQEIGTSKKDLLADILEDVRMDEPVVVFCRFSNDLRNVREVAEKSGRRYSELSGNANQLRTWQEGNSEVIGVQIQSGKESIDLTRSNLGIYYSLGFSYGDYDQSRKRLHRPGQTRPVRYIHLIAENSVDVRLYRTLEKREAQVKAVLDHGQLYRKEDLVADVMQDFRETP